MYLFLSFCIQLTGFYVLYNTSARTVLVKTKLNGWFYKHRFFSKALGSLTLLASFIMFMALLGIGVGFFFTLVSFMTISGLIIVLLPLRTHKSLRN